jgi:Hint domain
MKGPWGCGTRRQLLSAVWAGLASVPLVGCDDSGGGSNAGSGSGGTNCLLKGTYVLTSAGERPIEDLGIGDEVATLSGCKAVKWIGYNKYTKDADRPWLPAVMPIRVARSAIADQIPHSDVYLSPWHAVFINNVLIPVKHLVNGISIVPAIPDGMTTIEYYHIEFDTHEVVFAAGAPVESFREEGTEREYFQNFVEYERLYGCDAQRMVPFAPILRYNSRREKIAGLARSLLSNVVDVRDPVQIARDQLARRAEALLVV